MNLLIVDDEFYIVQGIVNALNKEMLGIEQIYTAYSAEQARKIISRNPIDILLTDIEMPKEDGLSLIHWIRQNAYHMTILILTGHQRFDYAKTAIATGCFCYLLKPIDMMQLENELKRAVISCKANVSVYSDTTLEEIQTDFDASESFNTKIQSFIRQNLHSSDLSRNVIAEYMHMNPDYLSTLFHTRFGQTLSFYITAVRIDYAKELLKNSTFTLNEIADKTGFSTSSYFCKQFKKYTSMTPQQYRFGDYNNK